MTDTLVLWFTGLSGSGKTTIANRLVEMLNTSGKQVLLVDGDSIRSTRHKNLKFTPEDITENNRLIALHCKENLGKYDFIVVSAISPFAENRRSAARLLHPRFREIYIKTDLQECIRRDVKGLYKKALAGEIENFIGISASTPYEIPAHPDLVLDTQRNSADECVDMILTYIGVKGIA